MGRSYIKLLTQVWFQRSDFSPEPGIAEEMPTVHHLNFKLRFEWKVKKLKRFLCEYALHPSRDRWIAKIEKPNIDQCFAELGEESWLGRGCLGMREVQDRN